MKRFVLVAVLLIVGTALAMAGGQAQTGTTAGVTVNPPGTYPIVDTPVTIDVWTAYGSVEDDGNIAGGAFTAYFEDLTNVKVNFVEIVEGAAATERMNLVLASGDLPDAFMRQGIMSGQMVFQNGTFGNFIPVDDLIDEWMPGLTQLMEEYPQYNAQLVMPDGKRYSFPSLEAGCYHCTMSNKFWVYEPWLEAVGMSMPQTTEEFYNMLVAFREQDPNGNGIQDEIPMAAATTGWNGSALSAFLMNSFIYTDPGSFLKRDGSRLSFVANSSEWRDGIRFMARLYSEGLLAPESFVQTDQQLRAIVENQGPALVGSYPAGWYGVFMINNMESTGRVAGIRPMAPLTGPTGLRQATFNPPAVAHHTVITRDAEHPEVIARLNDWFYESLENNLIGRDWMREGIDYRWLTPAERESGTLLARDGSIADFLLLVVKTYGEDRFRDGWYRTAPLWNPGGGNAMPPEWAQDPTKQEWILAESTRNLYEPYKKDHHLPPGLIVSDDVQDELADVRQVLLGAGGSPGLVQQFYAEFVTGSRNINNDGEWNAYVNELNRAGVSRYVEIMQQTLTAAGY